MDNAQARFLLHAARPDGRDDADPIFAEPLEQARRDPALGRWLEEERRLDALLTAKLGEIAPPAELRAALFAAPKVVRFSAPPSRFPPVAKWFALAAAVVLFLSATMGMRMARPSFAGYQGDLYAQIVDGRVGHLGLLDPHLGVLKEWLAAHGAPTPARLPLAVLDAPSLGCRTFLWHGTPVAQVCFRMKDGQVAHLFVIGRDAWRSPPSEGTPDFGQRGEWGMACWRDHGQTYLLAKPGSEAAMKKLLL